MRLLQIDTINVVARSPYLVLFSRLGPYETRWLDELLARGAIFECWAHEACFAPMGDFAWHRHPSPLRAGHWAHKSAARVHSEQRKELSELIEQVRARGAVRSADFDRDTPSAGGWWNRSGHKRRLEAAFVLGELMIARRENFQRVYDLAERVLAAARWVPPETVPDAAAMRREFLLGAARSLGVSQARWLGDYFRLGRTYRDADLDEFVEAGELVRVAVRGWDNTGYVHRDNMKLLARAARGALRATHTTLLSPFDPVVWHRERASTMFGFDYTIECYLPAPKRRYGYFVLPILHRGRLVGRLDAKAHRNEGLFEVKAAYLESDIEASDVLTQEVVHALNRSAEWHGTPRVVLRKSEPRSWARALRSALAAEK
jgi:uncharacterized protein YcaQ